MRVGICVPQFRGSVEPVLAAARAAEDHGLDGVFVFDHVWALNQPERPAENAWPLLGALATETSRVHLGTLVARVGLMPVAVQVHSFESLHRMAGTRLIAGLGTGDRFSRAENEAVGAPYPPADARLAALADTARALRERGITTWVGGRSARIREVAVATADALNLWGVEPERIAGETDIEVTWGGPVPSPVDACAELLSRQAGAGATWAACAPPYGPAAEPAPAVAAVAEAAASLR